VTLLEHPPPDTGESVHPEPFILVPYIDGMLHNETVESVRASGYPYALHALDPEDPYAYAALFADNWGRGSDLIIVEQDMIVPDHAVDEFEHCLEPWCSHTYDCDNEVPAYGLGICRFRYSVQQMWPTLGEQAARDHRGRARRQHWTTLNERIISLMLHWGVKVHLHEPEARHLHYYGTPDAAAG